MRFSLYHHRVQPFSCQLNIFLRRMDIHHLHPLNALHIIDCPSAFADILYTQSPFYQLSCLLFISRPAHHDVLQLPLLLTEGRICHSVSNFGLVLQLYLDIQYILHPVNKFRHNLS